MLQKLEALASNKFLSSYVLTSSLNVHFFPFPRFFTFFLKLLALFVITKVHSYLCSNTEILA